MSVCKYPYRDNEGDANPSVIFQTWVYELDGFQTQVPGYPGLTYASPGTSSVGTVAGAARDL
jgi:hypothetical protein